MIPLQSIKTTLQWLSLCLIATLALPLISKAEEQEPAELKKDEEKHYLTIKNKTPYTILIPDIGLKCPRFPCMGYKPGNPPNFARILSKTTVSSSWDYYSPTKLKLSTIGGEFHDFSIPKCKDADPEIPQIFTFTNNDTKYKSDIAVSINCNQNGPFGIYDNYYYDYTATISETKGYHFEKLSSLNPPLQKLNPLEENIAKAISDLTHGIDNVTITNNTDYNLFIDLASSQPNNVLSIAANEPDKVFHIKGLKFMSGPGFHFGFTPPLPSELQPCNIPQQHNELSWTSVTETTSKPITLCSITFVLDFKYLPPETGATGTGTVEITINKKQ